MFEWQPSDMAWLAIAIILLGFVGAIIILLWQNGHGSNGLKGELEARVTDLENDNLKVWAELKRQANRWIP